MKPLGVWLRILRPAILYVTTAAALNMAMAHLPQSWAADLPAPLLLLPGVLLCVKKTGEISKQGNPDRTGWLQWALVTALMVLANTVWFRSQAQAPDLLQPLAALSSVLCGPICEELIYRGLVLQRALDSFGRVPALLLSATLFGAAHIGPMALPAAFLCGLLLGWMRLHFNSLIPPIITHSLLNLAVLMV